MATHKVAVIQMYPEPLQVEKNFEKAASYIRSAALQKAELAVLPEYHLASWCPDLPGFRETGAQWKTYLDKYRDLARECNICIVPGTILELHTDDTHDSTGYDPSSQDDEGGRLLNVAYFIDNKGEILGKYVKKNLWGNIERLHLTSSAHDMHPVFDTPFGKVGLLICWDLAFPEAFREMISKGAKLFIIPTFWTLKDCTEEGLKRNPTAEVTFLDAMMTARCFENTCAIIFANVGGPPGHGYCGLSQVCVPWIGPVAKLGSHAEGMSVVDLDMQIVEDAEKNYGVRADLARDDWHYLYRHNSSKIVDDTV